MTLSDAVFLAPPELEAEVRSYSALLAEKSGLGESAVDEILTALFGSIGTVSYEIPKSAIQKARRAIGEEDPADVPYLATAITVERAAIWSDDEVFGDQRQVKWYSTPEVIELYEAGQLGEDR